MPDSGDEQRVSPAELKAGIELETEKTHKLVVDTRFEFSS